MHINRKHLARKADRAKYSPAQPTHKIIWEKVFRRSAKGVEHYKFIPLLAKI